MIIDSSNKSISVRGSWWFCSFLGRIKHLLENYSRQKTESTSKHDIVHASHTKGVLSNLRIITSSFSVSYSSCTFSISISVLCSQLFEGKVVSNGLGDVRRKKHGPKGECGRRREISGWLHSSLPSRSHPLIPVISEQIGTKTSHCPRDEFSRFACLNFRSNLADWDELIFGRDDSLD